jgi:hypothetical protein
MAYSTNPNLPKARAIAMRLLVQEQLPRQVVANRCGVARTTIWRWKRKWDVLNKNVQLTNDNWPGRTAGTQFRLAACTWRIAAMSTRQLSPAQPDPPQSTGTHQDLTAATSQSGSATATLPAATTVSYGTAGISTIDGSQH